MRSNDVTPGSSFANMNDPDRIFDLFSSLFYVLTGCQFLITYRAECKRNWIFSIAFFTIHMRHRIMVRGHMINNNSSYKNISKCVTIFCFQEPCKIQKSRTISMVTLPT